MSDRPGDGLSRRKAIAGIVGGGIGAVSLPAAAPIPRGSHGELAFGQRGGSGGPRTRRRGLRPSSPSTSTRCSKRSRSGSCRGPERRRSAASSTRCWRLTHATPDGRSLESLSAFDAAALARYSKPFAKLTADEQDGVLAAAVSQEEARAGSETSWSWFAVPAATGGKSGPDLGAHLKNLKRWVSGAYYSSETGMKELGWTSHRAFEALPACTHTQHGADEPDTSR